MKEVHPVNAYLDYFAVIASPSETVGAAIPCGAEKVIAAPYGRHGIASAVALRAMADRSHGLQLAMTDGGIWSSSRYSSSG